MGGVGGLRRRAYKPTFGVCVLLSDDGGGDARIGLRAAEGGARACVVVNRRACVCGDDLHADRPQVVV